MENVRIRISMLWLSLIAGFAIHNLADVMPIFWGVNVSVSDAGIVPCGLLMFMMAVSYTIPVIGLLCMLYANRKALLVCNLLLSCAMLAFNIFHCSELFLDFNPVQLLILPLILIVSILLMIDSLKLVQRENN